MMYFSPSCTEENLCYCSLKFPTILLKTQPAWTIFLFVVRGAVRIKAKCFTECCHTVRSNALCVWPHSAWLLMDFGFHKIEWQMYLFWPKGNLLVRNLETRLRDCAFKISNSGVVFPGHAQWCWQLPIWIWIIQGSCLCRVGVWKQMFKIPACKDEAVWGLMLWACKLTNSCVLQMQEHLVCLGLLAVVPVEEVGNFGPVESDHATPVAACKTLENARTLGLWHMAHESSQNTPKCPDQFSWNIKGGALTVDKREKNWSVLVAGPQQQKLTKGAGMQISWICMHGEEVLDAVKKRRVVHGRANVEL